MFCHYSYSCMWPGIWKGVLSVFFEQIELFISLNSLRHSEQFYSRLYSRNVYNSICRNEQANIESMYLCFTFHSQWLCVQNGFRERRTSACLEIVGSQKVKTLETSQRYHKKTKRLNYIEYMISKMRHIQNCCWNWCHVKTEYYGNKMKKTGKFWIMN